MLTTYPFFTNSTDEISIIQETFQNISILNFKQEININNKIPFLGVLIGTCNIDRFTTSTKKKKKKKKKTINISRCTFYFHSECFFHYKRTIIKTFFFSELNYYFLSNFTNELKNIKQTNYIADTEIKHFINKTEQHKINNTLNHKQSINLYCKNQFHSNYKIDEHILKKLIPKNILPTNPTKKVSFIIYYNKFKTTNLIISNNSPHPPLELLDRTNVVYMLKCPLGDCVSNGNDKYVGLTTTTLSRRLTMHLNDCSSIALQLKKNSIFKSKFRKILVENTTIIAYKINKLRLQILEALHIKIKKLRINRMNFENSDDILKYL